MPKGPSLLHAIVGTDSYLAEMALDRLLEAAVGKEREGAVEVVHGDETTWGRLVEKAQTGSLFVPRRAIVVRNAEAVKGDEGPLASYLEDPSPGVTLILLATKPDKRRVAWKRYLAEATVTSAEPKRGAALRAYVSDELRRRGLRLDAEGQEELLERVGQDLRRLLGEVDKLQAFAQGEKTLSAEDVAAVLGRGMARPLYLLSDAIASRDAARCLALLGTLLDDGEEPLRILGTLHRSLRQVRAVRFLKERRASREEISARLNLPPNMAFKVPALVEAAGRWSDAELERAVLGIAAQDRDIKNGADTRAALTVAVVGACGRGPRAGGGPRPWPRTAR
jgi:DNA polymerase III subunit delta